MAWSNVRDAALQGKSRIARQRMVNAVLKDEIKVSR
jgi:stress-induced morphogen